MNSQFTIGNAQHKFLMGAYYANDAYVGSGNNVGIMGGLDVVLMPNKRHFIADFLSGKSSVGTINSRLEWELPKEWRITVGALFPYPGSHNQRGAIVQISKN